MTAEPARRSPDWCAMMAVEGPLARSVRDRASMCLLLELMPTVRLRLFGHTARSSLGEILRRRKACPHPGRGARISLSAKSSDLLDVREQSPPDLVGVKLICGEGA